MCLFLLCNSPFFFFAARRRTFSENSNLLFPSCDDASNTLKRSRNFQSCKFNNFGSFIKFFCFLFLFFFLVSSSIKIPIAAVSPMTHCIDDESLEDLNKELENLCPFHEPNATGAILSHNLKPANSRFCDIFSRQSIESDENSSPDEERIKFLSTIPTSGCEVIQLKPKKPEQLPPADAANYQPCTNSTIQLKQSSYSAFRDMSEIKLAKQQSASDDGDQKLTDDVIITSHSSKDEN